MVKTRHVLRIRHSRCAKSCGDFASLNSAAAKRVTISRPGGRRLPKRGPFSRPPPSVAPENGRFSPHGIRRPVKLGTASGWTVRRGTGRTAIHRSRTGRVQFGWEFAGQALRLPRPPHPNTRANCTNIWGERHHRSGPSQPWHSSRVFCASSKSGEPRRARMSTARSACGRASAALPCRTRALARRRLSSAINSWR